MTTNHGYQAQKNTFYSFGGQANRGDGRDLAGGEALLVTEPKNHALSFLVVSRRNLGQDFVDLRELEPVAYEIEPVGASGFRLDL
jgi:hypothetical protein